MSEPDLNLLRVFDTLIEVRSVTRAAGRLGLTQSAVSHALARLRATMDDPLFVRGPGGLQPTTRAEEIAPVVRDSLSQLRAAFARPGFDPAATTRRFTIATGGYFGALFLPALVERVRYAAPAASIRVVPITETLLANLDEGVIDVAIVGLSTKLPARFEQEAILAEELVWIAARDNPIAQVPFDVARAADLPRVTLAISRPLEMPMLRDGPLGLQFHSTFESERDLPADAIVAAVYDTGMVIDIVARTDSIAISPRRSAEQAARQGRIAILAAAGPAFGIAMLWHRRQTADAGLAWFREQLRALA